MCGFARIDGTHKLIVLLLFFLYMFFYGVVNVDQVFKFFFSEIQVFISMLGL